MLTAFDALAEPRRRAILEALSRGEQPVERIAAGFDVTRPAISQHLAILREAGLVADRRLGRQRLYRIRPEGFADARAWFERFWDDALARLVEVAESDTIAGGPGHVD